MALRVPRFDDWFRPVARGGLPLLVRQPSPRDRVRSAVAAGLALSWALAVLVLRGPSAEPTFLWAFPVAWALVQVPFLVRTRALGWRGRQRQPLPPLGLWGGVAMAASVVAFVGVLSASARSPASDDDCRSWAALRQDYSRSEAERMLAQSRYDDLGCDEG